MRSSQVAVYFDVDDTVTRARSLESFLRHYVATAAGEPVRVRVSALVDFAARTDDLDLIHRRYVQAFAGQSWSALLAAGRAWYAGLEQASAYHQQVVRQLRAHQDDGSRVVFVSGSWLPCLAPIAEHLGVIEVICTVPALDGDALTGQTVIVMVGTNKAVAVRNHATEHGIDLRHAAAYGDDASDEPMLRAVGHPVVVGADPILRALAARHGWPIIGTGT